MRGNYVVGALGALALLAGCATTAQKTAVEHAEQVGQRIEQMRAQQAAQAPRVQSAAHVPWVSTQRIQLQARLPESFNRQVVFNQPTAIEAQRLLTRAQDIAGVTIVVENDVFEQRERQTGGQGGVAAAMPDSATAPAVTAGADTTAVFRMRPGQDAQIALTYQGSVRGLFDALASAMRVSWRYEPQANRVVFFRFESRTYRLAMVPGSIESANAVAADGGGAELGSTSTVTLDFWASVRQAIESKVSAQGAFTISETTGLLHVRDRPDVLARIDDYVERINENFSRQVTVDVAVFRVDVTDADRRALNFDLQFLNLAGTRGWSLATGRPAVTDAVTQMVFNVPTGAASQMAGSSIMFDILNQIGRTSVVTTSTLNTVNNQPVPLRVVRRINFLREVTAASGEGGPPGLTPGEVQVGFSAQLLPHVQDNGRDLIMQVTMSLSSLDRIDTFTSGANSIQLPQVSTRDFMQRVWLQSGQSLVLVGFENDSQAVDNQGMIPNSWLLGSQSASRTRERMVIVLTPVVRNAIQAANARPRMQ